MTSPSSQPDPSSSSQPDPFTHTQQHDVSEVALFIAKLIPQLPEETIEDLVRLLRRRLTASDKHRLRYARLGLLIDLVSVGTGELPSTRLYEEERAKRAAAGENDWPAHSTLNAAYGSWVMAVQAAMLLWRDGSGASVSSSNRHRGANARYSYEEATAALVACYEQVGQWPTEYEYDEWRRISRDLAHKSGVRLPRYPDKGTWLRMFGDWDAFDAAAKRRRARTHRDASPSSAPAPLVTRADDGGLDDAGETRLVA
jgi:hypothetical protein